MSEGRQEGGDLDIRARPERDDTNANLRAERVRTDSELHRVAVKDVADRVVEVARERAELTLLKARKRADRDMATAGTDAPAREKIAQQRAAEDVTISRENAAADRLLGQERQARERALAALLRLERVATDDGLLVERARADEVLATRDEFLGIVSHDLRNMLGGVALSAQLLATFLNSEGDHGAARLKHAERIQRFTARMNRLVGDLIDVVSLEAGKLQVTTRPTNAVELVRDAVEAFQPSYNAQGVVLSLEAASEEIFADCDHDRIIQVLANLLTNALKFTASAGRVTVSVKGEADGICIAVSDTGTGIPAGQMVVIFERFRQVGPKLRSGLGLGLYIAKSIVDAHGGTIRAADNPEGEGATFTFTLPAPAKPPQINSQIISKIQA